MEERLVQLNERFKELQVDQNKDITENDKLHQELIDLDNQWDLLLNQISVQKELVHQILEDLSVQQRTRVRLEKDQSNLEKEVARLESRRETLQESRGIGALRLLLKSGLEGIHGPVAHLGEVDSDYRLALEVAAGSRIGQIVVDNDQIAAKAIDQLKRNRAGRLTFLPLNKIKPSGGSTKQALQKPFLQNNNGLIGRAKDLIKFESVYDGVFSYVFGDTLVFNDLNSARTQLGVHRAVTLAGELIEKSGAMTGGSFSGRGNGLTFGTSKESDDINPLKERLVELGETLVNCIKEESRLNTLLDQERPKLSTLQQKQASLDAQRSTFRRSNQPLLDRKNTRSERLNKLQITKDEYQKRLKIIHQQIEPLILDLKNLDLLEKDFVKNKDIDNWKEFQKDLELAEINLTKAREERDVVLKEQQEYQLSIERLKDQQNSILKE